MYFIMVSKTCSNITLFVVCIERVICVVKPHHVDKILTKKVAMIVVLVIVTATSSTFIPFAFEFKDSTMLNPETNQTMVILVYSSFRDNHESFFRGMYILIFVLHFCLPVLGVVVCNVWLILVLLKRRRQKVHINTTGNASHRKLSESRELRTTKLVLAVTIVFVICVSPLGIYLPLRGFVDLSISPEQYSIMVLVSILLESVHFSANTFVYFLGSPSFRREVKKTFNKCYSCIRVNARQINPVHEENTRVPETTMFDQNRHTDADSRTNRLCQSCKEAPTTTETVF